MGAIWQLLYLNTTAPTETIVAALVQAAREKFDGQLGFTDYRVDRHLRCRNPQVLIGAEHIPPWGQRPLGMVVYSSFEGLTTVSLDMDGLNHFSDLRPEDLAGFDETKRTPYPGDEAHDCMLFCARLSELLETEVAFAVLLSNPAISHNALIFFSEGRRRALYFNYMPGDLVESMILDDPEDILGTIFDGRFAFLREPPIQVIYDFGGPDEFREATHFYGYDLDGIDPGRPSVYDPARSRLYTPVLNREPQPMAMVYYDPEISRAG